MKNTWLGDQLILMKFFENSDFFIIYFLYLYPIFVGSVYIFGKSDDDII